MTQEQLAKKLNISHQAVSKWENGLSVPDVEMLIILSETFDISVDKILKEKLYENQEKEFNCSRQLNEEVNNKNKIISINLCKEIKSNWNEILNNIKKCISNPSFKTWLKNITLVDIIDNEVVVLKAPNDFIKDWVEEKYKNLIENAIYEFSNEKLQVKLIVEKKI